VEEAGLNDREDPEFTRRNLNASPAPSTASRISRTS